ncbi:MAG: ATP-binding protein [Bifidobacteriaceae bacterium]|jgi:signal transduction histidine kinase|nr:ATP-binding protein [Bifidobacteriaceae bacterium]MCI1979187.1 ATP-binding protein [Bifidobacteriaceae bacterium]
MTERKTRLGHLVDAAAQASENTSGRVHPATVRNVTSLAFFLAIVGVVWALVSGIEFHIALGFAAIFLGIVSGWSQLSFIMNQPLGGVGSGDDEALAAASLRSRKVGIAMTVLSVVVTIAGVLVLFGGVLGPRQVLFGALAGFVILAAVALIIAPWWITLVANLGMQEAKTAREQLRLDFTAHLHDSVLQTLALIQLNADDPKKVAALAHAQERDLREWLYGDMETGSPAGGPSSAGATAEGVSPAEAGAASTAAPYTGTDSAPESLSRALKRLVADVEDTTERQIELVTVGDARADEQTVPLLSAAREAMLNAAHHGAPPYSVYLEVSGGLIQLFVRDHGSGFDTAHLPAGHLGVSESILGRMKRNGGTADIDSRPGWGTEVKLTLHVDSSQHAGSPQEEEKQ